MSSFLKRNFFGSIVLFTVVLVLQTNSIFAQEDGPNIFLHQGEQQTPIKSAARSSGTLQCPHTFNTDLSFGSEGEEVRLLQKILNADKRTVVAESGGYSWR
jgi:hypothetical protein